MRSKSGKFNNIFLGKNLMKQKSYNKFWENNFNISLVTTKYLTTRLFIF